MYRLGQLGAEPTGGHTYLTAEDRGQMALVGKPDLLRNHSERFAGSPQQGLCAFEPAPHHIAPRSSPSRLLERAAEVTGAQTGDVGQHRERKIVIEMRLDVIAHPLQPFRRKTPAGRQREMTDEMPSEANKQSGAEAFD